MGKGSRNRVTDHRAYGENFDQIRWKRAVKKFRKQRYELPEIQRRDGVDYHVQTVLRVKL